MAAKHQATGKSVQNSKTSISKAGYSASQRSAYKAVYKAAVKSAYKAERANSAATKRLQAAAKRAASRSKAFQRRVKGSVVKGSYLQAKYGKVARGPIVVPLRSQFRTRASTHSYLQAKYGKKTYALTRPSSIVRLKPRVQQGKIVGVNRVGVRKAQTNRSVYGASVQATNAARRTKANKHYTSMKRRKAAGGRENLPGTEWIAAGNDQGAENCVAVAIANSLLYQRGKRVTDEQVAAVTDEWLKRGLWRAWHDQPWYPEAELVGFSIRGIPQPGDIIGFESVNGPHCGVLLPGNLVVSWGEVIPLESEIEEAWKITWAVTG